MTEKRASRTQLAILALGYFSLWLLLGRYKGLQHDAQLYVFQALAKLQPEIFADDLYLKYGSQDDFTAFSHLSATLIGWLGIDQGAALLTLVSIVAWYVAAWLLARALVGTFYAWLGVGLFLAVPGWYGAGQVFQIVERFLSARLPAEAFCLLAVLALVRERHVIALVVMLGALAIHPLMTIPCIAVAATFSVRKVRGSPSVIALGALLCVSTLGLAYLLGLQSPTISGDWLEAVRSRSGYLFLDTWTATDWHLAALPILSLLLAMSVSSSQLLRNLISAVVCVALVGLSLTAFATWALPVKVVIQIQPWRWVWIAVVLAVLALPPTLAALWRLNSVGRVCAFLLITSWMLCNAAQADTRMSLAGIIIGIAAVAVFTSRSAWSARATLVLTAGAAVLLASTLGWTLSLAVLEVRLPFDFGGDPFWLQRLAGLLKIPAVAALAVATLWFVVTWRATPLALTTILVGSTALLVASAPGAKDAWSTEIIDAETRREFGGWQKFIGADQEVFWVEGLQWTWYAIERKSFLTLSQLAGIVFSEATTIEGRRRAQSLSGSFDPGVWFNKDGTSWPPKEPTTEDGIRSVCFAEGIDFYVSRVDVGLSVARAQWPTKGMYVYLYDCNKLRATFVR